MPVAPLDARVAELRQEPGRTWGVPDALLAVLAVPVAALVLSGFVQAGLRLPVPLRLVLAAVALGGLAVLAGRRPARQSGGWGPALGLDLPEWRDTWLVIGWTVLLFLAHTAAVAVLVLAVPPLRDVPPERNVDVLEGQPLGMLLLFAVLAVTVAPVVEEVLFRGVALRGLMLRVGFWPAALLSSGLFALLHVQRFAAGAVFVVVVLGTVGLGLCLLARRTARLGPCIGVHALYNAGVFLFTVATAEG